MVDPHLELQNNFRSHFVIFFHLSWYSFVMGNAAHALRFQSSPGQSPLVSEIFIRVSEELATSSAQRKGFVDYFFEEEWINQFLNVYSRSISSKEGKVRNERDGASVLSYFAPGGMLWTAIDENRADFYAQFVGSCSLNERAATHHITSAILLLPVLVGVALSTYVCSGRMQEDKISLNYEQEAHSPGRFASRTLTIMYSGLWRTPEDSPNGRTSSISDGVDFSKTNHSCSPVKGKHSAASAFSSESTPEFQRLRGLIKMTIDGCKDRDYLEFLLTERNDDNTKPGTFLSAGKKPTSELTWIHRLEYFFETLPLAVAVSSTQGNEHTSFPLVYVNREFEVLTQFSREDVVGQNCRFLHSEECTEYGQRDRIRSCLHEVYGTRVALTNVRRDGSPFYNLLALQPVFRCSTPLTFSVTEVMDDVVSDAAKDDDFTQASSGRKSLDETSETAVFQHFFPYSHVIGIQYDMKRRDAALATDLLVVEDTISLLFGIMMT